MLLPDRSFIGDKLFIELGKIQQKHTVPRHISSFFFQAALQHEANVYNAFKERVIGLLTGQDGITYIAKDNVIEYSLDEPSIQAWAQILRLFNGQRTLKDILHECCIPESSIQVHLEEALEYEVIETC